MQVEPLKWPIEYKRGFLADIPVIGSDFRLRKAFYRQLKSRSHATLELWEVGLFQFGEKGDMAQIGLVKEQRKC